MFNIIWSYTNLFMLLTYQFLLLCFFKKIISCFIYIFPSTIFVSHIFKLNIPKFFNTSTESSTLNIFSSSVLHLQQIIERNIFSKMYILGFLNFLYLPQITQKVFFHLNLFSYWKYFCIILSFFLYSLGENKFP